MLVTYQMQNESHPQKGNHHPALNSEHSSSCRPHLPGRPSSDKWALEVRQSLLYAQNAVPDSKCIKAFITKTTTTTKKT